MIGRQGRGACLISTTLVIVLMAVILFSGLPVGVGLAEPVPEVEGDKTFGSSGHEHSVSIQETSEGDISSLAIHARWGLADMTSLLIFKEDVTTLRWVGIIVIRVGVFLVLRS